MSARNSRKLPDKVLVSTYKVTVRLGSATRAAEELGISRQAVDQRLSEGSKRGLFEWESPRQRITPERLAQIIRKATSIREAVEMAEVAPATLRSLARRFHQSKALQELKERRREGNADERKAELYEQYLALRKKLGREPTVYDLERTDRALYSGILYYYKSIDKFRKVYGIPDPEPHRSKKPRRRSPRVPAEERRDTVLTMYDQLIKKLGHHPSTSEMTDPKHPERARLYRLILKEYGTFTAFRRSRRIPKRAVGPGATMAAA